MDKNKREIVRWVHTLPCRLCRGQNPDYIHRACCKGCVSMLENLSAVSHSDKKQFSETGKYHAKSYC